MSKWESLLIQNRIFLVAFAFRMTGSLADAEDLVQDTFIECAKINPDEIKNHKSWLTKVCSNKGIDYLRSAYKRRETYPGLWLPDAVPDSFQIWDNLIPGELPEKHLLVSESLTTTFLLLIEKLNPEERVVYLLNEVLDYSFKEIAEFLNKSEDACRKTAQRARHSIASDQAKFKTRSPNSEKLVASFFDSAKTGDKLAMLNMLSDESEFWSDGGGKVSVASNAVISDKNKIADFWAVIGGSKVFNSDDYRIEYRDVNFRPGLIISRILPTGSWVFETIISFEIVADKIIRIYAQRNPDKLKILIEQT